MVPAHMSKPENYSMFVVLVKAIQYCVSAGSSSAFNASYRVMGGTQ